MAIIGNPIYQSAFIVDQFSGDGTTTAFTMSVSPAGVSNVLVAVSGVLQDPSTYGVVGTTLNFTSAPPSGTGNISCRYLGVPVTGVTTTAYRTVTEFTATASQTTFTPPSYTVGFINVYRNGVLLGSADYTATNGTTVVLATGATAGDLVTVESFQVSSVVNAIQNTAGSVSATNIATGAVTTAKIASGVTINFADGSASTPSITNDGDTNTGIFFPAADTIGFAEGGAEVMRLDSSGNVGIGTASPNLGGLTRALTINTPTGGNYSGVELAGAGTLSARFITNNAAGTFVGSQISIPLVFETNAIERMRIDASGRVTTPYQPTVWLTNQTDVTSTGLFTNWTVQQNVGSHYSGGTFTCPVAGTYFIYLALWRNSGTCDIAIRKNGTNEARVRNATTNDARDSQTVVFSCAANDTIDFTVIQVGNILGGTGYSKTLTSAVITLLG